jgi:pyruvate/2-oxoglutarate dehydrogenase complex dihydrolipoamide dehydrogenase (E3) component
VKALHERLFILAIWSRHPVTLSVAAEPVVPQIPGVDKKSVVLAADAYGEKREIVDRVAVIGGGVSWAVR